MTAGFILFGMGALAAGTTAYSGRWRKWAHRSGYGHNFGFSLFYFGVAFIFMGVSLSISQGIIPINALIVVWVMLAWCGIISYFWLPKFLLPTWFREGREVMVQAERAAKDLRKQAKALKKAERES